MSFRWHKFNKLDQYGFTLIELVIIIVVLGILSAVAIPRFNNMTETSKVSATKKEMMTIKRALVGNPEAIAGGTYIDRGYEGDVGSLPSTLTALVSKPGSVAVYDKLTGLGWNGPYIDSTENKYLVDAWGVAYIYNSSSRYIQSVGGDDTLTIRF